jgi:hypothetical protein
MDYGGGLLAAGEGFGEAGVYAVDVEDVAKDGADETISSCCGDNIQFTQRDDPELSSASQRKGGTSRRYSRSLTKSRSV